MPDTVRTFDRPTVATTAPVPAPTAAAQRFGARRSPSRLVLGVLLTTAVVLTFVTVDLRGDHKREVLAVTGPVAAGQVITARNVRAVAVDAQPGVPLIAAARPGDAVGHTAAVPLVTGELLSAALLGPAVFPPAGQAVVAVDVTPGHAPSGLRPGSSVLVLISAAAGASGGGTLSAPASVISVDTAADGSGDLAVSLLMSHTDALDVAGQGGDVSLILVHAGQ